MVNIKFILFTQSHNEFCPLFFLHSKGYKGNVLSRDFIVCKGHKITDVGQ